MIAYIKGIVTEKNINTVVVECGGIGYDIFATGRDIDKLSKAVSDAGYLVLKRKSTY